MSRECIVTGKKRLVANLVSHAHNKTKKRQQVNLQRKRIFDPETGRTVIIRVSTRGLKTLDKVGGLSQWLRKEAKKGTF